MKNIKGKITGITFFKIPEETWEQLQLGTMLTLQRDLENQYDSNAIKVLYRREQIGWVNKLDNMELAQLLDQGVITTTEITRVYGTPQDRPHIEITYSWKD